MNKRLKTILWIIVFVLFLSAYLFTLWVDFMIKAEVSQRAGNLLAEAMNHPAECKGMRIQGEGLLPFSKTLFVHAKLMGINRYTSIVLILFLSITLLISKKNS
ncbi:MAG: hypothetical protein A2Y62_16045 [Candidatus Fischerbacteria bacterium RBG_13_37_8]|uniref:Uncharacterized protein n=1 Tax=Candidatus Fischerbacteria bacterium RBG_13_37_8 TaxID=1817863 RepID=A0A1F5VXR1_9BACT|nr:MAG: hypothetical protein A2Y62_16045 [Candidatus Fischerbacteria bacterium RBG_13_37_8]